MTRVNWPHSGIPYQPYGQSLKPCAYGGSSKNLKDLNDLKVCEITEHPPQWGGGTPLVEKYHARARGGNLPYRRQIGGC